MLKNLKPGLKCAGRRTRSQVKTEDLEGESGNRQGADLQMGPLEQRSGRKAAVLLEYALTPPGSSMSFQVLSCLNQSTQPTFGLGGP